MSGSARDIGGRPWSSGRAPCRTRWRQRPKPAGWCCWISSLPLEAAARRSKEITYPEPMVGSTIEAHFVPVQVNTQDGSAAEVVARFRQVWTPDLRVLDADGFEYHRWNGYLPPTEFTARLLVARAEALLRRHQEAEATEAYEGCSAGFPPVESHRGHGIRGCRPVQGHR
jgi:hypothetical protein